MPSVIYLWLRRPMIPEAAVSDTIATMLQRPDLQKELQAVVRDSLARELHAATIIHSLSYRMPQECELATMARAYAVKLRHNLARINAVLPPDVRPRTEAADLDTMTSLIIRSLNPQKATDILVRFLHHHIEASPEMLRPFGEQLRSKGFERLWQRAARERARLAEWLRRTHLPEQEAPPRSPPGPRASTALEDDPSLIDEPEDDAPGAGQTQLSYTLPSETAPRIFHRPAQIVKWM